MAQRIVRAKRTLAEARVPLEVPTGAELRPRLASVLEVIYLIFNEGYAATAGEDWMRPALCEDALRVGRILAELLPAEAEVHGLVALMEIQASRSAGARGARRRAGPAARPGPLALGPRPHRPRAAALARAEQLAGCSARTRSRPRSPRATPGPRRPTRPTGGGSSPSMTRSPSSPRRRSWSSTARWRSRWRTGPRPALELVDALVDDTALSRLPPAAQRAGDLLARLGRADEARAELERAVELTQNASERRLLSQRAAEL